ncbi:endonuclease/exonuclease/phosphatase family protein [Pseudonocardia sp. MCCB 268]|nr:endonuclease/exonuclease/phosphatase family protein [Pseudonocardia cytotoxica]
MPEASTGDRRSACPAAAGPALRQTGPGERPAHPTPRPRSAAAVARRRFGPVRWAVALLLAAGAAGVTLPDLAGLDAPRRSAQIIAFRPLAVAVLAVFVVLGLLVTAFVRQFWPVPVLLALVAPGQGVPGAARTTASHPPPGRAAEGARPQRLRGRGGRSVAALIAAEQPDVVSIPSRGPTSRARPLLEPLGYRTAASVGPWKPTSAQHRRLGRAARRRADQIGDDVQFPHRGHRRPPGRAAVRRVPLGGAGAALGRPVALRQPRCGSGAPGEGPAVIAGDFSASFDHSVFREAVAGCGDAAAQTGNGLQGTWPTWAPRGSAPRSTTCSRPAGSPRVVRDAAVPRTDHRAIVATLRVP